MPTSKNNSKDNGMNNIKKESIDFNDLLVDKNNDDEGRKFKFHP